MKPFVKVDLAAARWMLRRTTHNEAPPDAVCQLELAAALVGGDLPSYSHREWAERWHCSPWKVRKHAEAVANQYPTTHQPGANQYATTLRQCFPHLRATAPTKANQGPTKDQPTNARLPYEKKKVEVEREEQQAPQAAPPAPEPKKPSPKQVETEQGIACLRTLRDEYLKSQGKKASAWGKAKGTQKRVRRFLDECRAREDELGQPPLACLEALGRWTYGAPSAAFWRRLPSPLEKVLGGKANDDCDRMARAQEALSWVAAGQPTTPAPKPTRGKPEHWSVQLAREHAEAAERDRTVITPDPRLFGGTQ